MTSEKIARINALAKKSREEGLTEPEKAEQAALRQEYLADIRRNVVNQLEKIVGAEIHVKNIQDIIRAFEIDIHKIMGKTIMIWEN